MDDDPARWGTILDGWVTQGKVYKNKEVKLEPHWPIGLHSLERIATFALQSLFKPKLGFRWGFPNQSYLKILLAPHMKKSI